MKKNISSKDFEVDEIIDRGKYRIKILKQEISKKQIKKTHETVAKLIYNQAISK